MKESKLFKRSLLHVALASVMVLPAVNFAEEADDENKITITGSHIKRNDIEGPSPVTTITSEDIENSGVTDLIALNDSSEV